MPSRTTQNTPLIGGVFTPQRYPKLPPNDTDLNDTDLNDTDLNDTDLNDTD